MTAYQRFQLQWMLDHDCSIDEMISGIDDAAMDGECASVTEAFDLWESEVGFENGIWPCESEFNDNEDSGRILVHPGETVAELLEDHGMTMAEFASLSGVPESTLNEVISGKAGITEEIASGLDRAFGAPKSFWLNLQANYDEEVQRCKGK